MTFLGRPRSINVHRLTRFFQAPRRSNSARRSEWEIAGSSSLAPTAEGPASSPDEVVLAGRSGRLAGSANARGPRWMASLCFECQEDVDVREGRLDGVEARPHRARRHARGRQ
jgi:hypothetical protein